MPAASVARLDQKQPLSGMEGDDGDMQVDDDLVNSPGDDGAEQQEEPTAMLSGGGGSGGDGPPKQKRNRKPTGWYDAMRDLTEPGPDGVVPPRPSDEELEAVNAAHGAGWVTLRQAREYVTEKRKTLARREARQGALGALVRAVRRERAHNRELPQAPLRACLYARRGGSLTHAC